MTAKINMPIQETPPSVSPTGADLFPMSDGWYWQKFGQAPEKMGGVPFDGWLPVPDTWAYLGANQVTVPAGALALYEIGGKVRLKQGATYKYFSVYGITDTTISLTGGSDFVIADAAITNISYSNVSAPLGHPEWFNWDPSPLGFSVLPTNAIYQFRIVGKTCEALFTQETNGTSNDTIFHLSSPVPCAEQENYMPMGMALCVNNSVTVSSPCIVYIVQTNRNKIIVTASWAAAAWTATGGKRCKGFLNFKIA